VFDTETRKAAFGRLLYSDREENASIFSKLCYLKKESKEGKLYDGPVCYHLHVAKKMKRRCEGEQGNYTEQSGLH